MKDVSHLPPDPENPGAVVGYGVVHDASKAFVSIFATWPEAKEELKLLGTGHSGHHGSYCPKNDKFSYLLPLIQR